MKKLTLVFISTIFLSTIVLTTLSLQAHGATTLKIMTSGNGKSLTLIDSWKNGG